MRQGKTHPRYLSYLLRLWETTEGGERRWRASLECPGTGERRGFLSPEDLFDFLRQETQEREDASPTER